MTEQFKAAENEVVEEVKKLHGDREAVFFLMGSRWARLWCQENWEEELKTYGTVFGTSPEVPDELPTFEDKEQGDE